jgi:fumarylacetoacetate (FAA) hydrolase
MKLATRDNGGRDGRLLLVDLPLARAAEARACATMLEAVSNWDVAARELRAEYAALASGDPVGTFGFDPTTCRPVLPYAPMVVMPADTAPAARLAAADAGGGLEVGVDLAVVVGPLACGADAAEAVAAVRGVTVAARLLRAGATTAPWRYAPVAATPDALDEAWSEGRLAGTLELAGAPAEAVRTATLAVDVVGRVVAAARDRELPAGTLVGPSDPTAAAAPSVAADGVYVDMRDGLGRSLFGGIALG